MGSSDAAAPEPRTARAYSAALRARDDLALVALLRARPDLASPPPSTLRALAARATGRASTDRALSALTRLELQVLEVVVALGSESGDRAPGRLDADAVTDALEPDEGVSPTVLDDAARAALERLDDLAVVWDASDDAEPDLRAAPGVAELVGPYPAGLGPTSRSAPHLDVLDEAPAGARAILDALAWGPPVGVAPSSDARAVAAADWLASHRLVEITADDHVVLPADVALVLRGGRAHRGVRASAPLPAPAAREAAPETVDAESASAAVEIVRLVADLLRAWEADPPGVLRTGGLAQRDLRRTAVRLDVDESRAAAVAELAFAAGLVVDDGDVTPSLTPTTDADAWLDGDLQDRWAWLAVAWIRSTRTPWLALTRDERGGLRPALEPISSAPWVPRLTRAVLTVLDESPGAGFAADDVYRALAWRSPRATPSADAVRGVLAGAELLGIVALGRLGAPGSALTASAFGGVAGSSADLEQVAREALAQVLPAEVDDLLLQGDLTGIVPGRPTRALARLVESAAVVESRGSALSVRFTPSSVTASLAGGTSADDLLTDLARHAKSGVPQPLEYLVRDAARRFGRIRVGAALSYVRVDDAALARSLVEALRPIGVHLVAPTVLAAQVPASQLHAALAAAGHTAAFEGPDGQTVVPERERARTSARRPSRTGSRTGARGRAGAAHGGGRPRSAAPSRGPDVLPRIVADLRATDAPSGTAPSDTAPSGTAPSAAAPSAAAPTSTARASAAAPAGTAAPTDMLALLNEAIAERTLVDLETVDGRGIPVTRTVRPLRLDGGRLRAADPVRDSELTVAVHRIARVRPVSS